MAAREAASPGEAPGAVTRAGDGRWWARASWPATPAPRGAWSYAPAEFDGVSRLLASGPDRVGAICLDGTRKARRVLDLRGGAWVKLRLQLHGRTQLALGQRVKIDTSRPAMVVVAHPHDQMKRQLDEERAPDSSIVLRFALGADSLPSGYCAGSDASLQLVLDRLRRAPHLVELPLTAELSRRTMHLLRLVAFPARPRLEAALDELDDLAALALGHLDDLLGRPDRLTLVPADRRRVLEARDIIEQHLGHAATEPLDLAQLPQRVGLNRNKLLRGFHVLFGSSVRQYLRRRRMELARVLIVRGDMSLADVAARAGFQHSSNFSAAYRAFHGLPPSREGQRP
jgi:AraC-like DNA-binding protein